LSLVATGFVKLVNGKVKEQTLIKSKPNGDKPIDEIKRLLDIEHSITTKIDKKATDLVIIEGLAFMARNTRSLVQLAGLNYFIRKYLFENKIPFLIVAPTSVKKFITGKGNCDKNLMLLEIYKRYGISFDNDNLADGYGLTQIGIALLDLEKYKNIPVFQQEVIQLLKKQL